MDLEFHHKINDQLVAIKLAVALGKIDSSAVMLGAEVNLLDEIKHQAKHTAVFFEILFSLTRNDFTFN